MHILVDVLDIFQEHLANVAKIRAFRQVGLHYADSERPNCKLISFHGATDNMRLDFVVF